MLNNLVRLEILEVYLFRVNSRPPCSISFLHYSEACRQLCATTETRRSRTLPSAVNSWSFRYRRDAPGSYTLTALFVSTAQALARLGQGIDPGEARDRAFPHETAPGYLFRGRDRIYPPFR